MKHLMESINQDKEENTTEQSQKENEQPSEKTQELTNYYDNLLYASESFSDSDDIRNSLYQAAKNSISDQEAHKALFVLLSIFSDSSLEDFHKAIALYVETTQHSDRSNRSAYGNLIKRCRLNIGLKMSDLAGLLKLKKSELDILEDHNNRFLYTRQCEVLPDPSPLHHS